MEEKTVKYFRKYPALSVAILFLIFSLIINAVVILILGRAYAYDVIHVFPTIFFYEWILDPLVKGALTTDFYLLPIILAIDFLVGMIVGFIINKIIKNDNIYIVVLAMIFLVYWFIICYQWLPVI